MRKEPNKSRATAEDIVKAVLNQHNSFHCFCNQLDTLWHFCSAGLHLRGEKGAYFLRRGEKAERGRKGKGRKTGRRGGEGWMCGPLR